MSLSLLLLDHPPTFLRAAQAPASALSLPLGTVSVLGQFLASFDGLVDGNVFVVPDFELGETYERDVRASSPVPVQVVRRPGLDIALYRLESADCVLVVDSLRWPVDTTQLAALVRENHGYRGVTHAIAVGAGERGSWEAVECDGDDQVKRVLRLYSDAVWPTVAAARIVASILPACIIRPLPPVSPAELRAALVLRGVLARDVPLRSDLINLTHESDFLRLHERVLRASAREAAQLGRSAKRADVFVQEGAAVHPSAQIVGPAVIQGGAAIEAKATLIGPCVVGARGRVGKAATVVQSVVASGALVPDGHTVWRQVVCGRDAAPELSEVGHDGHGDESDEMSAASLRTEWDLATGRPAADLGRWRTIEFAIKRLIDAAVSATALLLLSPLLIVVAILIKLDSAGPVLFTHYRERKGGKEFPCLKYRTMLQDAHRRQRELYQKNEVDGPQFKMRDDPRVTRVGRWLRATNIDELPQLLNVLVGHMSLVGPRPSPFRENQICVPWRRARLSVRPGVTGLWQLCRDKRSEGDFHQWIFYDLAYVRHYSLLLDVKIVVATALTLGGMWRVPMSWLIPSAGGDAMPLRRSERLSFTLDA